METPKNPFPKTLAATKTASILAIVAGLPVDANGHYLSDAQMANIETALSAAETADASLATAQANLVTANAGKKTAEDALVVANARIATLEAEDATAATATAAPKETVHVAATQDIRCDFDDEMTAIRQAMN